MNQILRVILFLWILLSCVLKSVSGVRAQDHYAVFVGVEVYDRSTFSNLEFSGDDAVALSTQFQRLGFNTTVMTSDSQSARLRPTTPKKIIDTIQAVGRSCEAEDTLVIGLSGHGVQFSDEELLPSGVRETYFCPGDADLKDKSSLLKISTIVDTMNQTKATKKLLLIDTCQENVLSTEGQKKGGQLIDLGSVHEIRKTVPGGIAILFSCKDKQFSWQHPPLGHSVFSYHVIRYLSGEADARYYDEGKRELAGLVSYVAKNTNDYVIQKNLTPDGQYPVLRGNTTNWILGNPPQNPSQLVNSLQMEFALIPAGTFMMGSPESEDDRRDNERQHEVTLSTDYYLGVMEVTQGQYEQVMGTNPSWFDEQRTGKSDTSMYPVEQVSWEDAVEFCKRLSALPEERRAGRVYRLPTEAEWEYACRAGSKTAYSFGDSSSSLGDYAWFTENSDVKTHPVGQKKPNAWGLYDMHGNVWEWCSDWWADYPRGSATDPSGPQSGSARVARGGSWRYEAALCRSAFRGRSFPSDRYNDGGFRVALSSSGIPR